MQIAPDLHKVFSIFSLLPLVTGQGANLACIKRIFSLMWTLIEKLCALCMCVCVSRVGKQTINVVTQVQNLF